MILGKNSDILSYEKDHKIKMKNDIIMVDAKKCEKHRTFVETYVMHHDFFIEGTSTVVQIEIFCIGGCDDVCFTYENEMEGYHDISFLVEIK